MRLRHRFIGYGWALFFSLIVISFGACSTTSEQVITSPYGRARDNTLNNLGLREIPIDLNNDMIPDQLNYYDPGNNRLIRTERDVDFDGRIDIYEYYNAEGMIVEEEMNLDFDSAIDVVRYYREDGLLRRALAVGFSGELSVIKFYDNEGNILRIERDSNLNGQIDTWEYFEDNQIVRVARDEDGDGTPESMETSP
jgi:hypothetical protein